MKSPSKKEVVDAFLKMLQAKIDEAKATLKDTISSRDNESKSTAGDKYETGRAMAQIAQQQNEGQLNQLVEQYQKIAQIDPTSIKSSVVYGSLVETNSNWFFISMGIGNIQIEDVLIYSISITSPLGQLLKDKTKGESVSINNKSYEIINLY